MIRFWRGIAQIKVNLSTLGLYKVRFWFKQKNNSLPAPGSWPREKKSPKMDQIEYVWYLSPKIGEIAMKFQSTTGIFMQEHPFYTVIRWQSPMHNCSGLEYDR